MSLKTRRFPPRPAPESPGPARYARATFDFSPSVSEELLLVTGDLVRIIRNVDAFWQYGLKLHTGEKGQFPRDFVKEIILPKHQNGETLLYALDAFYPETDGDLPFGKGDIIVLESKINNEWGTGRCPGSWGKGMFPLNYTSPLTNPTDHNKSNFTDVKKIGNGISSAEESNNKGLTKAKAIMNLTAQLDEELSFSIGDEITILEVMDDGSWYKGQLGDDVGTFPAAFVQLLKPLANASLPPRQVGPRDLMRRSVNKSWKEEELDPVAHDNLGTQYTDDYALQGRKLHIQSEEITNNTDNTLNDRTEESENHQVRTNVLYVVTAIHDYTRNTDQEISFKSGTKIKIYKEVDEHWLLGQIGDDKGYIARAYVKKYSGDTVNFQDSSDSVEPSVVMQKSGVMFKPAASTGYVKRTGDRLIDKNHVYKGPVQPANTKTQETKPVGLRKARAIYDYHASKKFDLTISTGEIVWVIKDVDRNWVEIKNANGKKGIVPNTFIRRLEDGTDIVGSCDINKDRSCQSHDVGLGKNGAGIDPSYVGAYNVNSMPVLRENMVERSVRANDCNVDDLSQNPQTKQSIYSGTGSVARPAPSLLKKSISADAVTSMTTRGYRDSHVGRSNSNPQKNVTAQDAREMLIAWCATRRASASKNQGNAQAEDADTSSNSSGATMSRKSSFTRGSSRSKSLREKRTRRRKPEATSKDTSCLETQTRQDGALSKRERHRTVTGVTMRSGTEPESERLTRRLSPVKARHADSISTTSTGSSSSLGESKNSRSSKSGGIQRRRAQRSAPAPPTPQHAANGSSTPDTNPNVSLLWSPPIPTRNQSLHHGTITPPVDTPPPLPDISLIPSRSPKYLPARPAPQLPDAKSQTVGETSPKKKVPPTRPANPPRSRRSMAGQVNGRSQERVRRVLTNDVKSRIEKIRSDIEEYSRMKSDLTSLYQSTLDGRERREISENMEFVKANLRRLQTEFQNLLDDQQDHIYESVERYSQARPTIAETVSDELQAPPLPPVPHSPGSIRQKRQEKRLRVVSELVETERDFLKAVTITVEDVMYELIDRQIPQHTITTLFANILDVKDFSEKLLKDMEEAFKNESSEATDFDGPTIGQVFIDCNLEMKEIYTPYYRNHDDAMTHLEAKMKEDADFAQIVQECLERIKAKVNVFDLGSFLIKPVQRFLKYPLLIEQLIKLTDALTKDCPSDHDKLILAYKMTQTIAKEINEDKRIKDLVRKYKDADNEGITEKLSKLNLKSIKKKSLRFTKKFERAAGISTSEKRDPLFDEVQRRFKVMERATKLFVQNVDSYCDKCRDVLYAELVVANAMFDIVAQPPTTHPVSMFKSMAEKMSDRIYRQFHDQVQLQVLTPISSLLHSFKSPQTIIDKRLDKLIDYERLLKHSDSKEKTEAAKHDYEALNKSLLDELPKLCDLSFKLLTSCTAIFARVHRDFESKLLQELDPLLSMVHQNSDGVPKFTDNMETYNKFQPDYMEAVQTMSRLQIVPNGFGAIYGSVKGTPDRRSSGKSTHGRTEGKPLTLKQPVEDKQALRARYNPQQLRTATQSYNASQLMDISCVEGDLVAVLKQSDPMGNQNRWFVDRGGPGNSTGFLPASILKQFDASNNDTAATLSLTYARAKSLSVENSPSLNSKDRSRSPSIKSCSSDDSANRVVRRTSISPHTLRQKLREGSVLSKDDGTLFTDEDISDALAEEEELLDDVYGDSEYPVPSPRSPKKHFRAEYDFHARTEIELSLKIGNIVSLIVPHDSDGNPDWWFVGNAEGEQGYVPANYLTVAEYL